MQKSLDALKYGKCQFNPGLNATGYSNTGIFIVGCGGTGGRIIPIIAQHVANHNQEIRTNPRHKQFLKHELKLILIDRDDVTQKNLKRQNFYQFDIGKQKSIVMAERYSALYGMDIFAHDGWFDSDKASETYGSYDNVIIFDCTDNAKARRSIESANFNNAKAIIISCGNEDTFGQVLIGTTITKSNSSFISNLVTNINTLLNAIDSPDMNNKSTLSWLPTLLQLHRDFKDSANLSCAELILRDEQSMPINALVAQLAYNAFYDIISGNPLKYNSVSCNIDNTFQTNRITNPMSALKLFCKAYIGSDKIEDIRKFNKIAYDINTSNIRVDNTSWESIKEKLTSFPLVQNTLVSRLLERSWYLTADQQAELKAMTLGPIEVISETSKNDVQAVVIEDTNSIIETTQEAVTEPITAEEIVITEAITTAPVPPIIFQDFINHNVCFTGSLIRWTRDEVSALVIARGGRVTDNVSINTTLLVAGNATGSKRSKAERLDVRIINENEFAAMLR